MEEAAFYNPASLSYFKENGSILLERDMLEVKDNRGNIIQKPKSSAVVLADGNQSLSGSLSYVAQEEGTYKRKRWGLSTSTALSEKSAFGVSLRRTKDENTLAKTKVDYWQTVLGVTHSLSPQTSLGFVVYDAFNSKGDATKAIAGLQHTFFDYITLAFDFGANYQAEEISDSLLYRGGIQLRVLDDFYARFGAFNDKERDEKGNGYGLAWVQPKLTLEFAMKNTKQTADPAINRNESKIREMSFSLSYRF